MSGTSNEPPVVEIARRLTGKQCGRDGLGAQPTGVAPTRLEAEISKPRQENTATPATQPLVQPSRKQDSQPPRLQTTPKPLRWYRYPGYLLGRIWDFVWLALLLSCVAAAPLVQLASLGYLLESAARLARGDSWSHSLPGLRLAGKLGTFILLASLLWLPVWLVADLSYSAQLLTPGTQSAAAWRVASFLVSGVWIVYVLWAAARGGQWWHFAWPAPKQFITRCWRPSFWNEVSEQLYDLISSLHFPRLWWLGARAAAGALLWTGIPVSLMIIGQRAEDIPAAPLLGLLGAISMTLVMLYLPFLQIRMAAENRFVSIFNLIAVRDLYRFAPLAFAFSLLALCILSIPLYLLRIETPPGELLWAPSLVFVLLMLPAKLLLGSAMGYAERRGETSRRRNRLLRWTGRCIALASVLIYVGGLYVAQLVAAQGAYVMYFQHAFLVPAPLIH